MKWYQLTTEKLEETLQVKSNVGLGEKQVAKRRQQYGENVLAAKKKIPGWILFLKQFQDFMVLVLLAATLVAGLLGEYIDAIAIMVIVLINGIIGYFQEQKAENSLEKLKELSAPIASVRRDGQWVKIPSKDIVVGDIVRFTSGDRVPADVRVIKTTSLETEESALTGESLPVAKHTKEIRMDGLEAQDQVNMAFMGTLVTRGSGEGIVVGTGMKTVMGQIATLLDNTKKTITPLEMKLAELGKILIVVALFLTILVVGAGIFQGHPMYEMFLAGVSLAVAAIPEGLPAIVTVALSLGVQRMIKKKAIVRKLSAVETLGCASVICSDKTGTMTENQMTVKEVFINGRTLYVTGDGYQTQGDFLYNQKKVEDSHSNLKSMLLYGMLCNHASISTKKGKNVVDGDPTDGALLVAAYKFGFHENDKQPFRIVKEIPFDSNRKRMSIVIEDKNGMRLLITKGAPDMLLPKSSHIQTEDGKAVLTKEQSKKTEQAVVAMAEKALRTIAIGFRVLSPSDSLDTALLEEDLTLIGLYGLMDPPRKEVKTAVRECKEAGIKTVMITGDHAHTARAIANHLEILPESGKVLEGKELTQMSDAELVDTIEETYVFARVTPEHKLRIVNAFQEKGHIVAMTGDGVNDAPAMKASDIGIAMGISGTDVTKEASSLVLMDDNFATIKSAIQEGRNIYENIRKFIRYLLASNVGEILVMLFAMLLGLPLPLVPVQILWVNLVTDGLPAMALGVDQAEGDVMKRGPRNPREGIFSRGLGYKIISRGILIGVVTLIAFIIAYQNDPSNLVYAQTIAFSTLVVAQLIHVFDCRSEKSIFARNLFENRYLILAVLSSMLLLLVVIYFPPVQPIFHTVSLSVVDWCLIVGLGALPTVLFGFTKK